MLNDPQQPKLVLPFPFQGNDLKPYNQARRFLHALSKADITVPQDQIVDTPKFYPDWEKRANNVVVYVSLAGAAETLDQQVETCQRLYNEACAEPKQPVQQHVSPVAESLFLVTPNSNTQTVAFTLNPAFSVTVEETETCSGSYAEALGIGLLWQEHGTEMLKALQQRQEAKPAGDGFDPFLDRDDLP